MHVHVSRVRIFGVEADQRFRIVTPGAQQLELELVIASMLACSNGWNFAFLWCQQIKFELKIYDIFLPMTVFWRLIPHEKRATKYEISVTSNSTCLLVCLFISWTKFPNVFIMMWKRWSTPWDYDIFLCQHLAVYEVILVEEKDKSFTKTLKPLHSISNDTFSLQSVYVTKLNSDI